MLRKLAKHSLRASAALALALPAGAWAQSADELLAMDAGSLRGEMQTRYDAALALTNDGATVSADSNRFMWASQAKAQCGIALGFLKSRTKDPVSVGKCVDAYNRMRQEPVTYLAPPQPKVPDEVCSQPIAGIVFFEFDSAIPPDSAQQTIQAAARNLSQCGWKGLTVTGHTDRSGSDGYNDALSVRRANAVSGLLAGAGAPQGQLEVTGRGEAEPKVPTPDGERNPTNRRVEITVKF
jgi:outer membrane protein OmpA-like peptidoglycan-associated protein